MPRNLRIDKPIDDLVGANHVQVGGISDFHRSKGTPPLMQPTIALLDRKDAGQSKRQQIRAFILPVSKRKDVNVKKRKVGVVVRRGSAAYISWSRAGGQYAFLTPTSILYLVFP